MTVPRVILFDLDDTLFQHAESVAAGVLAHRRAQSGPIAEADDVSELARWHALEEHHYHRYLGGELSHLEQRRARARDFVAPYDLDLRLDDAADSWFDAYLAEYRRAWKLHDDALPCLDALARTFPGVHFGIITNSVLAFQVEKLEAIELGARMQHIVASGELGFAKPDSRIFTHASEVFGVPPSEAAYVGDRLETDAIGASTAGMMGVWLCRGREPEEFEAAAAAASAIPIIATLAELPGLFSR